MNITTCGGYVVVINVPHVVLVNVRLTDSVQIVIGLFKVPTFFLQKMIKIQIDTVCTDGLTGEISTHSDRIPFLKFFFEKTIR